MLANVVEAHNGNPRGNLGIAVDASSKDDKVTVHAIDSEHLASKDVPHFPTQHGEGLETVETSGSPVHLKFSPRRTENDTEWKVDWIRGYHA